MIKKREDFMSKIKLDKSAIPKKLQKYKEWVGWKYGLPGQNGRIPKVPIDPETGKSAKTNDPKTWGTFKKAYQFYRQDGLDGVGFVFTDDDPQSGGFGNLPAVASLKVEDARNFVLYVVHKSSFLICYISLTLDQRERRCRVIVIFMTLLW
jgi:hypothetical protein